MVRWGCGWRTSLLQQVRDEHDYHGDADADEREQDPSPLVAKVLRMRQVDPDEDRGSDGGAVARVVHTSDADGDATEDDDGDFEEVLAVDREEQERGGECADDGSGEALLGEQRRVGQAGTSSR